MMKMNLLPFHCAAATAATTAAAATTTTTTTAATTADGDDTADVDDNNNNDDDNERSWLVQQRTSATRIRIVRKKGNLLAVTKSQQREANVLQDVCIIIYQYQYQRLTIDSILFIFIL